MRVKTYKSKYGITSLKRGESIEVPCADKREYQNIRVAVSLAKSRHGWTYRTKKSAEFVTVKRMK